MARRRRRGRDYKNFDGSLLKHKPNQSQEISKETAELDKPVRPNAGMLVLTRKRDESIMIGDIEVKVVDVKGGKVRLGIKAPKSVTVDRREIYLEKQVEKEGDHDSSNSTAKD